MAYKLPSKLLAFFVMESAYSLPGLTSDSDNHFLQPSLVLDNVVLTELKWYLQFIYFAAY